METGLATTVTAQTHAIGLLNYAKVCGCGRVRNWREEEVTVSKELKKFLVEAAKHIKKASDGRK